MTASEMCVCATSGARKLRAKLPRPVCRSSEVCVCVCLKEGACKDRGPWLKADSWMEKGGPETKRGRSSWRAFSSH